MAFYNYNEAKIKSDKIEESWGSKEKTEFEIFKIRSNFNLTKKMWDSYGIPEDMKKEETLVGVLQRRFSNIPACVKCRPLGNFHEFAGMSHEEIYNKLVEEFTKQRMDARGNLESYVSLLYPYMKDLSGRYNNWNGKDYDKYFHRLQFEQGLSIMLYRSSIGIWLEAIVNEYLTDKFENHREFFYKVAPSSMESDDIDGIIYRRDTEEVAVRISIKTMGAFTNNSIFGTWRKEESKGGKGKTLPDIYIGIEDENDIKIKVIKVDNKSLKDLLLSSRSFAMAA